MLVACSLVVSMKNQTWPASVTSCGVIGWECRRPWSPTPIEVSMQKRSLRIISTTLDWALSVVGSLMPRRTHRRPRHTGRCWSLAEPLVEVYDDRVPHLLADPSADARL